MARIRSIHPEQWTDEDFAALSFGARLLAIGVRNLCDDKGVFEWKPVGIKMKLFPADSIDVVPLLDEMVANDQCVRFEVNGKSYGAVRNFRVYQRPQKPNDLYPLPDRLFSYVGLPSNYEPDPEPVRDQSDTTTGIADQMEDVGVEKEGEESPLTPQHLALVKTAAPSALVSEFEKVWPHYPRRVSVGAARKAWVKARATASFEEIAASLRVFIPAVKGTPIDKIPHFATWLNGERWKDDHSHAANRGRTSTDDLQGLATITATDDLARLMGPQLRALP